MTPQTPISPTRDDHARKQLRGYRHLDVPVAQDPDVILNRNVIVRAGAGSGKTSILIDRLIVLVRKGVPPSSIVAITFTNRAAAELKERFFKRLLEVQTELTDREGPGWAKTFKTLCASPNQPWHCKISNCASCSFP